MEFTFELSKEDLLIFQLYVGSNSKSITKKRKKARFIIPITWGIVALIWYFILSPIATIIMLIFVVIWVFIYPKREEKIYRKFYLAYKRISIKQV